MGHAPLGEQRPHLAPHGLRDGVEVRVGSDLGQTLGEIVRLPPASAVDPDELRERPLVLRAGDMQVPTLAVPGLADALDTAEDPEAQQEA